MKAEAEEQVQRTVQDLQQEKERTLEEARAFQDMMEKMNEENR
jgi:hypothetical protein